MKKIILAMLLTLAFIPKAFAQMNIDSLFIRIADIEIYPDKVGEFNAAGKAIAETSVKEEPGVICLLPLAMKDDSTEIRVIEVYKDQGAYDHHIHTAHFLAYKKATATLVKLLKLNTMGALAPNVFEPILRKLKK